MSSEGRANQARERLLLLRPEPIPQAVQNIRHVAAGDGGEEGKSKKLGAEQEVAAQQPAQDIERYPADGVAFKIVGINIPVQQRVAKNMPEEGGAENEEGIIEEHGKGKADERVGGRDHGLKNTESCGSCLAMHPRPVVRWLQRAGGPRLATRPPNPCFIILNSLFVSHD